MATSVGRTAAPAEEAAPAEPPLAKDNVVTRLVYLLPTMWPEDGTGHGWVAKVTKLSRGVCTLQLPDGSWDFKLAAVLALKAVS